jgi:hypothetical protein
MERWNIDGRVIIKQVFSLKINSYQSKTDRIDCGSQQIVVMIPQNFSIIMNDLSITLKKYSNYTL